MKERVVRYFVGGESRGVFFEADRVLLLRTNKNRLAQNDQPIRVFRLSSLDSLRRISMN